MLLPRPCMRSPFPLFFDAKRTLLRNHSSISIVPQRAHSCKGSSDPQSCCYAVPSNTSVILGHVGSPVTSSVVAGPYPQAAAAGQGHKSLHGHRYLEWTRLPDHLGKEKPYVFWISFPQMFFSLHLPWSWIRFVYVLPRFPVPVGPGTVPLQCLQCPLPLGQQVWSLRALETLQTQSSQTTHSSGDPGPCYPTVLAVPSYPQCGDAQVAASSWASGVSSPALPASCSPSLLCTQMLCLWPHCSCPSTHHRMAELVFGDVCPAHTLAVGEAAASHPPAQLWSCRIWAGHSWL